MLYLITGANGAGKTLNALKWVRERSLKESRPVCHNGRFEPVPGGELADWKHIDIKDWQNEPDGTIFLVDECHNDFPLRAPSSAPPDYVKMLAEHRRRGFDFYLITQHPQNIDAFVRRLIGSPGWHRHLKRTFGGDLVSCLEWPAVNSTCERDGSGKTGTVTMIPFPKEVFGWYKSASLHTAKTRIPWRVWLLVACIVIIPLLIYLAITSVHSNVTKGVDSNAAKSATTEAITPAAASGIRPVSSAVTTAEDYVFQRIPRLPDFPHTAPVYDDVTKPVQAPYPAACVQSSTVCKCYTQQGTLLRVDVSVCVRIVAEGFFVDWDKPPQQQQASRQITPAATPPVQPQPQPPVLVAAAPVLPTPPKEPGYLEALRLRNAEVRSVLR